MLEVLIGFIGALVGAAAALGGIVLKHSLEVADGERRDGPRRRVLLQMLENPGPDGWRQFEALARVIGADRAETTRLLVEVGARGSEKGNDVWALVSKKPLP
jgi:hypothetical protein